MSSTLRLNSIQSPCKDCSNRHLSCWSKCLDYKTYKDNLIQVNSVYKKEKLLDTMRMESILRKGVGKLSENAWSKRSYKYNGGR